MVAVAAVSVEEDSIDHADEFEIISCRNGG
jgi:hypothetical protein